MKKLSFKNKKLLVAALSSNFGSKLQLSLSSRITHKIIELLPVFLLGGDKDSRVSVKWDDDHTISCHPIFVSESNVSPTTFPKNFIACVCMCHFLYQSTSSHPTLQNSTNNS
jgi:hypothetical protein